MLKTVKFLVVYFGMFYGKLCKLASGTLKVKSKLVSSKYFMQIELRLIGVRELPALTVRYRQ